MSLELHDNITSELNYAVCLCVPWHLHEANGSFSHRSDGNVEDWACHIIEVLIEVTQSNTSAIGCSDSTMGPPLILSLACCSPSLIFILWGIRGQVVLIMLVEDGHVDMVFRGVIVKV